jgi:hypothetical protein
MFIVNWWYTTVDPGYTGDTVFGINAVKKTFYSYPFSLYSIISSKNINCLWKNYIHTHHSRFIPEGIAEASQLLLRDAHGLSKSFSYE